MQKLQSLDIPWRPKIYLLLVICSKLKELTVRMETNTRYIYCGNRPVFQFKSALDSWLEKWVMEGFLPQTLNIVVVDEAFPLRKLVEDWLRLNPFSPTGCTGCLKLFSSFKVPLDLFPAPPDFQLEFGESCALPIVKPSKYGLLGLIKQNIVLTNYSYGGETVHKAMMRRNIDTGHSHFSSGSHFNSHIFNLSFVSHFDGSHCRLLCSGHLEQLAMACPNLLELNLRGNVNCLKSLQGLHTVATYCHNLRGLNILLISLNNVESHIWLWEILANLKLTTLLIELCTLIPHEDDQTKDRIVSLYQNCLNLKALEADGNGGRCNKCRTFVGRREDFLLLSNLPSLIHLTVATIPYDIVTVGDILTGCLKLKYLTYTNYFFETLCSLTHQCDLEQLSILSRQDFSDNFMSMVSAHGGLVHVLLHGNSMSDKGVTTLVENSPKLFTCHIYAHHFNTSSGDSLNLKDFKVQLQMKFSNRKLFSNGSCHLFVILYETLHEILEEHNTDLMSFWHMTR